MIADKQVRIYPGVDLLRAALIVDKFSRTENAQEIGYASAAIFGNQGEPDVLVYATRTAIIVRPAQRATE